MENLLLNSAAAAVSAIAYFGLLGYAVYRIGKDSTTEYWLAAACGWSVLLAGAFALDALNFSVLDFAPGIWLAIVGLCGMCVTGALTFSYLGVRWAWVWLVSIVPLGALVFGIDSLDPAHGLQEMSWRLAIQSFTISGIVAAVLWVLIGLALIIFTFSETSHARLPLYANRGLWWGTLLPILMAAEATAIWAPDIIGAAGQGVRVFAILGLAYGATTHDLVDMRGLFRGVVGNALFVAVTALITLLGIAATLLIFQFFPQQGVVLVGVIALVLALLYQAIRSLLDQIVKETVYKTGYDTAATAAEYSKRIAQILDVGELAAAIGETLTQSLEATKSALLLFAPYDDNENLRAEVFVGNGQMPTVGHRFPASSVFLTHLARARKPLQQYTLEVSDQFKPMLTIDRRWLQRLGGDTYVPIMDGEILTGIIAVGPRKSRDPYRARELELLQSIADQTAVALANARLVTDLKGSNEEIRGLNVTLEERNEQLREMDRVKTDFITIASHELRTPLTQILGFADILQLMSEAESIPGTEIAPITDSVLRASHRLNEVVTQMLDVSQMDVEAMQLNLQDTTVETAIKAAVEPFGEALKERRLGLTAKNLTPLPHIQGDAERLSQAFRQIISNAIKFTPDGGSIQITCRHVKDGRQPEAVEIVVADTGVGISPKYHDLIFEKFFRVGGTTLHSTGTTKFMGAGPGLGLPLTKGIVEAHGGRIWVESPGFDQERCPGTQMHVLLPVRAPAVAEKNLPGAGVNY